LEEGRVGGWEAEEDGERGSEAERAREGNWGQERAREKEKERREGAFTAIGLCKTIYSK
jgi:hypothetical protein